VPPAFPVTFFNVPYLPTLPIDPPTNGVIVNSVTVVPEPSTWALAGSALVATMFVAWRRRSVARAI
jgi:hypothetical protein